MKRVTLPRILIIALAAAALGVGGCPEKSSTEAKSGSGSAGSSSAGSSSGTQPAKRGTGVFAVREKVKVQEQLRNLGVAYTTAIAEGKAPKSEEDVKDSIDRQTYDWIKERYYKVYWGVDIGNLPKSSETVLAYENTDIEGGRFVLLAGGAVTRMTKKEFDAAPKAGK